MKPLAILSLLLAVSSLAFADGNTSTASTAGSVTVVAPIKVTKLTDLNFGTLVVDTDHFSPGGLSVGPNGQINGTALGHGTWLFTGSGHPGPSAATFTVTGTDGYPFGFTAMPFIIALKDGSQMTVTPNIVIVDGLTHGLVPSTVSVGGQLGLLNGKAGLWSGTFRVTAFYL